MKGRKFATKIIKPIDFIGDSRQWRRQNSKIVHRQCRAAFGLPGFPACLGNRPDQSPQQKPRRSRTHRAFLKPRSTAPSSVHFTSDRLRSASISETPAQCERHPKQMMVDQPPQQGDSGRWVAVPDDCFVTRHQMLYGLMVKKDFFQ